MNINKYNHITYHPTITHNRYEILGNTDTDTDKHTQTHTDTHTDRKDYTNQHIQIQAHTFTYTHSQILTDTQKPVYYSNQYIDTMYIDTVHIDTICI